MANLEEMLRQQAIADKYPSTQDVRRSFIDRTNRTTEGHSPTDFPAIEPGAIPPRITGSIPRQSPAAKPTAAPRATTPAPRATAAPAPAAAQPLMGAQQPAALQDFLSQNPASKYDDDLQFSRLMMSSLQQIGDVDGYNQFKGAYADALTKRYKDVMGNAIISAQSGDFAPARAAYNHLVPNNRKVVGYGSTPDGGLRLKFDDGRVEAMSPNRLMGLMNARTEPDNVLKLYQAAAEGGIKTQGKMAEQANQFQYDAALEQVKNAYGAERDKLKLQLEARIRQQEPEFKALQFAPDGRVFKSYSNGRVEEIKGGTPGVLENTTAMYSTEEASPGMVPRGPSSGWTGSLTGQ